MIPKINNIIPKENYILEVEFDDGKVVDYDLNDDMNKLPNYDEIRTVPGLYQKIQLDKSRTCVSWTSYIDLPSDMIYEYGSEINGLSMKK